MALLALTAGVLVVFDSVRGGSASGGPAVVVQSEGSATAGPAAKTASASGVSGVTKATTTVRGAPGQRTAALGNVPSKSTVEIDGRTTDTQWVRIIFPPNSELHGWIDASELTITGDPTTLVVATAEPAPIVELPTEAPSARTAQAATQAAPVATPTIALSPTSLAGRLPDLVVGTTPVITGGKLFVTVVNQGQGDSKGDLVVAIFNSDSTKLLGGATLPNFSLAAGRSIDIGTGLAVTQTETLVIVVDPNGTIDETDNTNNRVSIAIAVGDATPTPNPFSGTPTIDVNPTIISLATETAEAIRNATVIALATETAAAEPPQ